MELVVKERTNGTIIAKGTEAETVRIFEGNWYYAPEAVQMEHLKISDRTYTCPYKGVCYWIDLEMPDGRMARNVAWVYRQPKADYEFIQDQIGFYARTTSGTLVEKAASGEASSAQQP
jgi:uncharacterized protein (DUF427 family)